MRSLIRGDYPLRLTIKLQIDEIHEKYAELELTDKDMKDQGQFLKDVRLSCIALRNSYLDYQAA